MLAVLSSPCYNKGLVRTTLCEVKGRVLWESKLGKL